MVVVGLVVALTAWCAIGQERVNRGLDDGDGWPWIVSDHRVVRVIAAASFVVVGILATAVVVSNQAGQGRSVAQ